MTMQSARRTRYWRTIAVTNVGLLVLVLITAPSLHAQDPDDLDAHSFRINGYWFYSKPYGSFHGTGSQGRFELQRDAHFDSYNTGGGRVEWKFTRKNHLYFGFLPINQTKQFVLDRTIVFEGQTFDARLVATARTETYLLAPGYQYDIIRRKRGHLGIVAQLDLFYIKGSLKAEAQTLNGTPRLAQVSSSSLRAPLPVAGPDFRYYLTDSGRLFVSGNLLGMYFFGYGNFISSYGTLGWTLNPHLNVQGGYQLSSRLDIKSKTDRIGLDLTQRGAVAGLEVSF